MNDHIGHASPSADQDRRLLMSVAYRLLGSVTEAADAVQEAHVRWYGLPADQRAAVVSRTGWLVTVVSRICLDVLGSARSRREHHVGDWLPEPVADAAWPISVGDLPADPADRMTLDESVTMALLVVLDTMTPAERVAFVLHDVFRYPFAEIAEIVGRSPDACRQLAASARRRVRSGPPARHGSVAEHASIVAALRQAWQAADIARVVALLDPSAAAVTDSGGSVSAPLEAVTGASSVARMLVAVLERQPDLQLRSVTVNQRPGLIARARTGEVLAVISVDVADRAVRHLWIVRNPVKLRTWAHHPG